MSKKQPAYDFKEECNAMLARLGAKPGGRYDSVLPTIAGALSLRSYEDWLACSFDDVKLAQELINFGSLNRFSGKWNWHYTNPTELDMLDLYKKLASVTDTMEDQLIQQYAASLLKVSPIAELNTLVTYIYRDADNYKATGSVVFSGAFRRPGDLNALLFALDRSESRPSIIPGEVGLADLQDSFSGCESRWDPERDHPWHEITSISPALVGEEVGEVDDRSIYEFVDQVAQHALLTGWDEAYKPEFYPEMAARHERHVREQEAEQ